MPRHPSCALKDLNTHKTIRRNCKTQKTPPPPTPTTTERRPEGNPLRQGVRRARDFSVKRCSLPLYSSQTTTSTPHPTPQRMHDRKARNPEKTADPRNRGPDGPFSQDPTACPPLPGVPGRVFPTPRQPPGRPGRRDGSV